MATASHWEFEGVNVESLLIGVGKEPDKVVLLETLGVVFVLNEGAGGRGVPMDTKESYYGMAKGRTGNSTVVKL